MAFYTNFETEFFHTVFTRRFVLKETLRRDQKVIFVKSPISSHSHALNRYGKFVNAFVACNPGLPLVEAKRKADDARRETGNGENEEEVEMMLSAEASLEEKDKRLARSSFVVDRRGLEEGQHRLLSENVR